MGTTVKMSVALNKKPDGEWLSISEIAKRCNIHRQTCTSRIEDLGYEPDEDRSTPKNKVYFFDDEMEFAVKSAKDTVSAMKIRDLRATAQLKEMKLAEARGELVPMIEVMELSQKLHTVVYKHIAIDVPKRLASKLAKAKTPAEVTKILKLDGQKFLKRIREASI
jgi:hypothetical protein